MPKCIFCNTHYYGNEHSCKEKKRAYDEVEESTQSEPIQETVVESRPAQKPVRKRENGPTYDKGAPDRVKRWRESNREEYNRYMREYRRRNK